MIKGILIFGVLALIAITTSKAHQAIAEQHRVEESIWNALTSERFIEDCKYAKNTQESCLEMYIGMVSFSKIN